MIPKHYKVRILFSNKYFLITLATGLIIIFILIGLLLVLLHNSNTQTKKFLSASNAGTTTTVYGVEMQKKCLSEFQDFEKNYGQDHTKCLVDFDFSQDYCGASSNQGLSGINIVVILDASGSMADNTGAGTKMDIAKKAVSDFLTEIPQGINTGLIVYGDKGSASLADKSVSCAGIEEVVKLGPNNSSNIISAMNSFSPKGWTPIAGSLEFAKNIFVNEEMNKRDYLILVSDGGEDCGGNPFAAADDLKTSLPELKLDIIGFTSDSATHASLKSIATLGGGLYLTALTSSDIANAFNQELAKIKIDCINVATSQISINYNINNLNNLNCMLAEYQKESDDLNAGILNKSTDTECNSEISDAFQARQNEFWKEKDSLVAKDDAAYKTTESDLNNQLNVLNTEELKLSRDLKWDDFLLYNQQIA